jgi:hypothetical protein
MRKIIPSWIKNNRGEAESPNGNAIRTEKELTLARYSIVRKLKIVKTRRCRAE